jgi:hypothetical protein
MVDSQEPEQYVLGLNYPVRADWFDDPTGIRQQSERRRSPAVGEDGPVLVDCSDSRCWAL